MKSLKKTAVKYFEFYKVYDDLLIGKSPTGNVVSLCDGKKIRASVPTLIRACAEIYGPGNYVALELGRSPNSLPLSYWVLKIRQDRRGAKHRVILRDEELQAIRRSVSFRHPTEDELKEMKKILSPEDLLDRFIIKPSDIYFESAVSVESFISEIIGKDIFALERQKEAGLAATHMRHLKDPEDLTRKKVIQRKPGRPKGDNSRRACELRSEGKNPTEIKAIIKNELIAKGVDPLSAEDDARNAIEADKKARNRMNKKPRTRR